MRGAIAFFDAIAERYDKDYILDAPTSRERMRAVVTLIASAGRRVLDLGVGTGRELPQLLDGGFEVTGLDASQAMLDVCARRARPIPLVLADFFAPLPFADESFDAVIALHGTLAHPEAPESFVNLGREIARVLAPGGVFIAEAPSPGWVDAVARGAADDRARRAVALDVQRTEHEDVRTGARAVVVTLSDAEWHTALGPSFGEIAVEPLSAVEWRIVARRAV